MVATVTACQLTAPIVREPLPVGWHRADRLLHDESLLRSAITAYGNLLGAPSRQVASALAFKAYSYLVIEPVVTAWLTRRRVPDLSLALTAIHLGEDGLEVAVTTERASVLADDPLAGAPGMIVVPSEDALLDALRRTLVEGHLAPAVEAFRQIRGGGARPLWGSVAQSLCYPASVADPAAVPDRHGAIARLLSVLKPDVAELVEVAELDEGGGWRPALLRRTCCYYYTVPSGELCTTCCLLTDEDRDRRAAAVGAQWRRAAN
jgi:ferric iron reductase protein FhuF